MTDKRDIQRRIKSIKSRGEKIDKDIHETGVLCMVHARDHGDISLMTDLVDAMPKSGRRKGLITWVKAHIPAHFNEKEQSFKLKKNRTAEDFQIAEAEATPFWEYNPSSEHVAAEYDLEKAINACHRALKKARDQGNLKTSEDVVLDRLRHTVHDVYATAPQEPAPAEVEQAEAA